MPARFAFLFCFFAASSFAATWSGVLVDSGCWLSEERNVNPTDTLTSVDRDRNQEIRYCAPRAKTKLFRLVTPDGLSLKLDSNGDAKAAELVRSAGKQSIYRVDVTGNLNKETIAVDSIAPAK